MITLSEKDLDLIDDALLYGEFRNQLNVTVYNDIDTIESIRKDIGDGKIKTIEDVKGRFSYMVNNLNHYSKHMRRLADEAIEESECNFYRTRRRRCNQIVNKLIEITPLPRHIVDEILSV